MTEATKLAETQLDTDKVRIDVLKRLGNPKGVTKVVVAPVNKHAARVNVWGAGKIIHTEFYKIQS